MTGGVYTVLILFAKNVKFVARRGVFKLDGQYFFSDTFLSLNNGCSALSPVEKHPLKLQVT